MYLQRSCGRCRCSRVIQKTATENLDVLPATIQLAGAEIELVPTISGSTFTKSITASS